MQIKNIFQLGLILSAMATLTACGDDSSSSAEDEPYSSVASFKSSSSLSNRADIDYKDTVSLGDTMRVYVELFDGDSSKMDSTVVYIDSAARQIPMYLGHLPKGSRIKVYASTSEIKEDSIRIKSEQGQYMSALIGVPKEALSKGTKPCGGSTAANVDTIFSNYFSPSYGCDKDSTFRDSNQFVVFNENHYYLEIAGEFNNKSSLRLKVLVDSSYYRYTGTEGSLSLSMNDTLRGIIDIDNNNSENIDIAFSAKEGYSVALSARGNNISQYRFTDGSKDSLSSDTAISTILISSDSIKWTLSVSPEKFSNFMTGPYATFEAATKSRALEQGEYFSLPDSITYLGETHKRNRPKDDHNNIYRYNLRQEQYIWIGDYVKGDSLIVYHEIDNYNDDSQSPATCEIIDKDSKVVGSISCTQGGSLKITDKMSEGPYYLHYIRLNSYPLDQVADSLRYVLQLYTTVQQPGLLKSMQFYDLEKSESFKKKAVPVGDTIRFSNFHFKMEPVNDSKKSLIGSDIVWFVPCQSLAYLNNNSVYSCLESEMETGEQEISSNFLVVQEAEAGTTAKLIAQSVADPAKRDTLTISIVAKK